MPFDPTHSGRPPPVFYLADLSRRPSGHALVSPAAPHIHWRRQSGKSTTTSLAEAGTWTEAQLDALGHDPERVLAVPAPLAARLAVPHPNGDAGLVVINHAHLWLVFTSSRMRALEAA